MHVMLLLWLIPIAVVDLVWMLSKKRVTAASVCFYLATATLMLIAVMFERIADESQSPNSVILYGSLAVLALGVLLLGCGLYVLLVTRPRLPVFGMRKQVTQASTLENRVAAAILVLICVAPGIFGIVVGALALLTLSG